MKAISKTRTPCCREGSAGGPINRSHVFCLDLKRGEACVGPLLRVHYTRSNRNAANHVPIKSRTVIKMGSTVLKTLSSHSRVRARWQAQSNDIGPISLNSETDRDLKICHLLFIN